jgi:hypothetical protein
MNGMCNTTSLALAGNPGLARDIRGAEETRVERAFVINMAGALVHAVLEAQIACEALRAAG